MKTTSKEEKEREDIEIERKVRSKCFLCEEEYSTTNSNEDREGNIMMNKECLHSYCKECIEQSASTSLLLCPICHSSPMNGRKIYSEEEKEKRNKMTFSNQLIQNQNLLSHFGSKGTDPFTQFDYPFFITYNDKLNIIAVSDLFNNRVKIMDKKGALIRCFPFQSPRGIAIIPSLSLLAVSSHAKHVIEIFDISPLLPPIHNNNNHPPSDDPSNNYNNKGKKEFLSFILLEKGKEEEKIIFILIIQRE